MQEWNLLIDRVTNMTSADGVIGPENPDIDTSRYSLEEATDYVVEQIAGLLDKEEE
ncbi:MULTISPECIES: hypothetical protein [Salibacterium]|uniref:Uncharacterized protein n=1 Tax=Salibacterium lacus TaxID=1898109 RepID=A0ABW5T6L6_9BACI|nr:hypothetical protein [Salibacterium qingdaonense]